jgi:hypothetical protein
MIWNITLASPLFGIWNSGKLKLNNIGDFVRDKEDINLKHCNEISFLRRVPIELMLWLYLGKYILNTILNRCWDFTKRGNFGRKDWFCWASVDWRIFENNEPFFNEVEIHWSSLPLILRAKQFANFKTWHVWDILQFSSNSWSIFMALQDEKKSMSADTRKCLHTNRMVSRMSFSGK